MAEAVVNALTLGSVYLLFSLGLSLVWGTTGVLNFAHGAVFMFSVFVNWALLQSIAVPLPLVLLIGAGVGVAISLIAHVFVFQAILRRAETRQQADMQILIAGIGFGFVPVGIAQLVTLNNPFGLTRSGFVASNWDVFGTRIADIQVVVIVVAVVLASGLTLWLRRSRTGLALRSIGSDPEVASLMGVDERTLGLVAMAVAGALAGLAGPLLTFTFTAITPESGDILLLKAFAIIILGGVGSMLGTVVGAYFLAAVETLVLRATAGSWVDAIAFGVLVVVLLLRPQGLFGRREVRRT